MAAYCIRFTVVGSGRFPYDMLRYDGCHPSSSADVMAMTDDDYITSLSDGTKVTRRTIMLTHVDGMSKWQPTVNRWHSFGWQVHAILSPLKI